MRQSYDVTDRRQGHMAVVNLYQHHIKADIGRGLRGRLTWEPINTETRAGMRAYFHGILLKDFAAYTGESVEECKRQLTEEFCPPQFDNTGTELKKSTERMSDAEYSDFLLQVEAFCVVDTGIEFTEQT